MIRTLVRVKWLSLKRDYAALVLTFAVPLAFFTVFAAMFGKLPGAGDGGSESQRPLKVIVVDEDHSDDSRRLTEALRRQAALEIATAPDGETRHTDGLDATPQAHSARDARQSVRSGTFAAAIVIPAGWGESFGSFHADQTAIELVYDAANPLSRHSVSGLLQAAAMEALPDRLMNGGFALMDQTDSPLSPAERRVIDSLIGRVREQFEKSPSQGNSGAGGRNGGREQAGFAGLVKVEATSAQADENGARGTKPGSLVSYYAAGLGVMFLLFSVVGAGGALLEEESRGTLERMLAGEVGMSTILLGTWLFNALLGFAQVTLMFLWGAAVFGIQIWSADRLLGLVLMTAATASAAAAFGLVLAACCKSQAQLNGFATILVMVMSALGGSMVPRFVMPSFLDTTAKFTFNGWALDGYLKVLWYNNPGATLAQATAGLLPQLAALGASTVVFMVLARLLARRWEVL